MACTEDAVEDLLRSEHGGVANEVALNYRNHLLERKLQPATVNRRLAALRSMVKMARLLGFVTWSIEVESLDADPYRDTRGPGTENVVRMVATLERRVDAKGIRDVAMVRLMHDVALRRGEVASLDLEHVDVERGIFVLGKGRKKREWMTLPAPTKEALWAWIDVRGGEAGAVFTSLDERTFGHRLTGSAIYAVVRKLGKKLGVKTRPHGLRHTAITSALDKSDGNTRAVKKFSRHVREETLEKYDDNRTDLAGKIAALVADIGPTGEPES